MVLGKRKRGGRAAVTRPRKLRRVVKKPRGAFKKKVLQVIQERCEDKQAFHSMNTVYFNGAVNSDSEFYTLLPGVAQGSDTHNRIGDQIRGKYLEVKGHVQFLLATDTDANCRIAVRLMVVSNKTTPSYYASNATVGYSKLLSANGSNQQYAGDILSSYLPINREAFTVHYDRIHYMSISQLYHAAATDIEVARDTRYTTKFFTVRIPCKKLMHFADGAAYPSNFNPQICLGYAHVDGSAADTAETQVTLTWVSKFVYEDA